jgi:hypothetical protein
VKNPLQPAKTSGNESPFNHEGNSAKMFVLIFCALLLGVLVLSFVIILCKNAKIVRSPQQARLGKQFTTPKTSTPLLPARAPLTETKSIDPLNPLASIRIPFVRDGSIHLYEDGVEKLVAEPAQNSTKSACFDLAYPLLSPNGKYLAYIQHVGDPPGIGGCMEGFLRIVETSTGANKPTAYKTSRFNWTPSNRLDFMFEKEDADRGRRKRIRRVIYSPSDDEEVVYEQAIDIAPDGSEWLLFAEYPSYSRGIMRFRENTYYLVNENSNTETFLFSRNQVKGFLDWSPNGRYAIFESAEKPRENVDIIELVVDTQNPKIPPKKIGVGRGSAGGEISTGRKWYFEKGYVTYCRQELYFVDGSSPLQLTHDDGGGCHNEEGFVATSPSRQYAFVKFADRFELHTKHGDKKIVHELTPLTKNTTTPKNLIWLNDDYVAIFESTYGGHPVTGKKPKIYLFDRKANTIRPVIENGYLITHIPS